MSSCTPASVVSEAMSSVVVRLVTPTDGKTSVSPLAGTAPPCQLPGSLQRVLTAPVQVSVAGAIRPSRRSSDSRGRRELRRAVGRDGRVFVGDMGQFRVQA